MRLSDEEWEGLCRRCGLCCYEKWRDGNGRIHLTGIPCEHLDVATSECRIYPQRLQGENRCIKLTPDNVGRLDWLPPGCGYRRWAPRKG